MKKQLFNKPKKELDFDFKKVERIMQLMLIQFFDLSRRSAQ